MKKQTVILVLVLTGIYNITNAQNWIWANGIGSPHNGQTAGYDMPSNYSNPALDLNGNIYMAGYYNSSPLYFQTDTLSANGLGNFFLAKYDATGNLIWAKAFGLNSSTTQSGVISSIVYDSISNAIYIAGGIGGSCYFGSYLLTPSVNGDIFLAKYDLNGNCLWANQSMGSGGFVGGFALDVSGNIYLAGISSYSATISSFSVSPGGYIAKYDSGGNCLWAKSKINFSSYANSGSVSISSLKIYNSDLFISGVQTDDTLVIDTMTIYTSNTYGQVIARFDSTGGVKWVKIIGAPEGESYNLGMDSAGNCYFSGDSYANNAIFDSDTLSNSYTPFMFIAKYDKNGSYQWAKEMAPTGANNNQSNGLYTDAGGNSYVLGSINANVNFGSFSITPSPPEMFVARYDNSGNCIGDVHFHGGQGSGGIIGDATGAFYATGNFFSTVNIGSTTLTSHGNSDIFIAKHDAILTGIGEDTRVANNQLIIYANPNKGTFSIQVPDEVTSLQGAVLIVYDNTGRETSRFSLDNSSDRPHFNVVNAASGMYIIKLVQGNNVYVGKLVVQ